MTAATKPISTPRPPIRLYSAGEIGNILGVTRNWVLAHMIRPESPREEFTAIRGKTQQPLWTARGVDEWRAYHAGDGSIPRHHKAGAYSDHNAVNQVGPVTVTWKLWWRCLPDGGVLWWFSTPDGWYASHDDGITWSRTDTMVRPSDYHYYSVNTNAMVNRATVAVLRSTEKLRLRIEEGSP